MNYMENTYVCLAAPLLLAVLCLRREGRRSLLFTLSGMTACLFSAYVSAFLEEEKASGRIDELAEAYIYRYISNDSEESLLPAA